MHIRGHSCTRGEMSNKKKKSHWALGVFYTDKPIKSQSVNLFSIIKRVSTGL